MHARYMRLRFWAEKLELTLWCTGPDYGETMEELETLFDRFSRHASNAADPGRTSLQCDYGNTVGKMKATRAFVCKNDDEVRTISRNQARQVTKVASVTGASEHGRELGRVQFHVRTFLRTFQRFEVYVHGSNS
jgi:hypothetical protein